MKKKREHFIGEHDDCVKILSGNPPLPFCSFIFPCQTCKLSSTLTFISRLQNLTRNIENTIIFKFVFFCVAFGILLEKHSNYYNQTDIYLSQNRSSISSDDFSFSLFFLSCMKKNVLFYSSHNRRQGTGWHFNVTFDVIAMLMLHITELKKEVCSLRREQ